MKPFINEIMGNYIKNKISDLSKELGVKVVIDNESEKELPANCIDLRKLPKTDFARYLFDNGFTKFDTLSKFKEEYNKYQNT